MGVRELSGYSGHIHVYFSVKQECNHPVNHVLAMQYYNLKRTKYKQLIDVTFLWVYKAHMQNYSIIWLVSACAYREKSRPLCTYYPNYKD